jgi:hypothetical protein
LRAVFVTCVVCFALAIYSGGRIVSETHLHMGDAPVTIPGVSNGSDRDSSAAVEQAQRIRASRLLAAENRRPSALDAIIDALGGR